MWAGGIFVVLLLVCVIAVDRVVREKYQPLLERTQKEATEYVGFFCEQQEILARDPWFHTPRTEGDAGPLLNAWLPWKPELRLPDGSPLAIPAPLPQKNEDFQSWLEAPSVDPSGMDFEWMQRLRAFDRWDLLKNAPVAAREPFELAQAKLPDFGLLRLWAKLRLLHGVRSGQPREAAEDVRHLAWLAYRTDTIFGAQLAEELLQLERQAHGSVQAPAPEWQPMSARNIELLRVLTLSSSAFSYVSVPADVAKRARRCGEPVVTRCIAMGEAAFLARFLKPFAEDDYAEQYRALAEDFEAFPCPTSVPRTVWERGVTADGPLEGTSFEKPPGYRLPRPILRRHLPGALLAAGTGRLQHLIDLKRSMEGARKP
jgi:hypothetical protein